MGCFGSRRGSAAAALAGIAALALTTGVTTAAGAKSKQSSTCSMDFVASVRHGPLAGKDYEGILRMKLGPKGALRSVSFHAPSGKGVEVDASIRKGTVSFRIPTPD